MNFTQLFLTNWVCFCCTLPQPPHSQAIDPALVLRNVASSSNERSPCISTLSSSSLCIDASLNRQCTPVKNPDVDNVHQKMWDRSQISTRTLSPPMPMDACFWVMVIPGRMRGKRVVRKQNNTNSNSHFSTMNLQLLSLIFHSIRSPFTCIDPSDVALITAIQANPKSPKPIIALGLINKVNPNNTAVKRI